MDLFQKMVRQSIVNHPTFFCPISKRCLDVGDAILVEAWNNETPSKSMGVSGPYSIDGMRKDRTVNGIASACTFINLGDSREEAIKCIVYRMIHHNENIGQVSIYRGWEKSSIYELNADNEVIEA